MRNDPSKEIEKVANQILQASCDSLIFVLRFLDLALCKPKYHADKQLTDSVTTDGYAIYYDPRYVFEMYKLGHAEMTHLYLHIVMHCIFSHPFVDDNKLDSKLWDMACDIAVESIISELIDSDPKANKAIMTPEHSSIVDVLNQLVQEYGVLTAEKLYRKFQEKPLSPRMEERVLRYLTYDDHSIWYMSASGQSDQDGSRRMDDDVRQKKGSGSSRNKSDGQDESNGKNGGNTGNPKNDENNGNGENQGNSGGGGSESDRLREEAQRQREQLQQEWKDISERMQVDLETESQNWGSQSGNLMMNIREVNREKYDYTAFLKKFAVLGEAMQINDDEFDYIFYTHGLGLYGNVPLVEPLEYKDVKRIKEFVIAIDTSGSVYGEQVQRFLQKTYNILLQNESFFSKINVHIIQCDAAITHDFRITKREEFDAYLQSFRIYGGGGTDFRPVFHHVNKLIEQKEFENLKGLIYFTDGYGDFPAEKPPYDAAFVFVEEDERQVPQVPVWAIKLILRPEEL